MALSSFTFKDASGVSQTAFAILNAGQLVPGAILTDLTGTASINASGSLPVAPSSKRNAGVLHRNAITAVDKLSAPAQATGGTDVAASGSLAFNTAFNFVASAFNRWGNTTVPAIATVTTANDAANTHAVRFALAQVSGADGYDIFMTTAANPLWVARITETQRATAGCRITAVGTVDNAGAGAGGTVQVNVLGTQLASNVNPFLINNAYTPATPTAVNCAGYSRAHILVKLAVTDLRSLPTCAIVPFLANQVSGSDFHQGKLQTLSLLTATGQSLEQDFEIDVDGSTGLVVLLDTVSGQGSALSAWVELA